MREFLKNYRLQLILSFVLMLIPTAVGLILWNRLPEMLPVHFGLNGEADDYASKIFTVVWFPLILDCMHILTLFFTSFDKKNRGQSNKVFRLTFFMLPFLSVLIFALIYSTALGFSVDVPKFLMIFMGILFVVIGNYLPKCKQNYTIGIKIKWTLENEEVWNATHRFAGRIWVVCGVLFAFAGFLPKIWTVAALIVMMIVILVVPILYSYILSRNQKLSDKNGK